MTSPGAQPTDAERDTAIDVYLAWLNDPHDGPLTALIAQALADHRARYEEVAQELDYYASKTTGGTWADGAREAAERIRAALNGS
jgi:hypothetical protein